SSTRCITQDHAGVFWIAAHNGGFFYGNKETWRRFDTPPDFAKLIPNSAFTDEMGRVWFGYVGGTILELNEGKIQAVLPGPDPPIENVGVIEGHNGHLWFGGRLGLAFFDGHRFHPVLPSGVLFFAGVSGIKEMADGSLWLAEARGVIHIDGVEIRKF